MIIHCWGSRGSITVSGKQYLRYGGNTTCLEIRTKDDKILIVDAGSGMREAGNSLMAGGHHDFTLLLTHAHWDHIIGFPFFKPIYSSKTNLNILGCPFARASIKELLSRIMEAPNFPVNFDSIRAKISYQDNGVESFRFGSMVITPVALSHPNQGTGYKFEEDGKCFVFLTDNELGYKHEGGLALKEYIKFADGADLLFHDAEYKEEEYKKTRGWGHSSYKDALHLALNAGVKKIGLFHHNQERIDDEIDVIVKNCQGLIKKSGKKLECIAVGESMEFKL
ncbi:MAG: MBL fold metallo-hydrolase [Deltaproteobacteria bacterium HGW-Deltaproteobacteria-13]|jgi:phosphoribosyl 1,2-cyclic phosphodiesterase|nr:MAG: MBL fold metallo-hydrolase [Deltaproteobacteria bacterium HGW-Deltaproteobacteria-13]